MLRKNYLNFYTFAGGGSVIYRSSDEYKNASGFYVEGGGGVEWFIPWNTRLAFDLELGLGFSSVGNNYSVGLLNNLMGLAGFHYF